MEKLNELIELAKKATPGKWWIDSHGHTMVAFIGGAGDVEVVFATDSNMGPPVRHDDTGNLSHWRNDNDATFIAAANPATILAIAEAFRALEQDKDKASKELREMREAERKLSDAYIRLRGILGSLRIPAGSDIWDETEKAAASLVRNLQEAEAKLAGLEKQEPVAWLVLNSSEGYVERNPDVVAHLEAAGLTKCKPLFTRPAPILNLSELVPDDYFAGLVNTARASADKAMLKFPQPNYVLLKVAEEAGEVVQAGVHYAENRMTWQEVEGEIVQLLAMLIRLVTEGDQVNGITPPDECRAAILRNIEEAK